MSGSQIANIEENFSSLIAHGRSLWSFLLLTPDS
jgi:hypothetical protein